MKCPLCFTDHRRPKIQPVIATFSADEFRRWLTTLSTVSFSVFSPSEVQAPITTGIIADVNCEEDSQINRNPEHPGIYKAF